MKKENFKKKILKIKVLIMDVDGVLTNGKINIDSNGKEIKVFDAQDGMGIHILKRAGIKTAIISARSAEAVTARVEDLKIDIVCQDAYPKLDAYRKLLKDLKLKDEEACFMGDDIPDICLLKRVGFAVAVKNACSDAKRHAHYITKKNGGDGAVREVVEMILKTQDKWKDIVKSHE